MLKNTPVTLLIVTGLMAVLIIFAGILPLFGGINQTGMSPDISKNQTDFVPGDMTPPDDAKMPEGSNAPSGGFAPDGTAMPDRNTPPEGFNPQGGSGRSMNTTDNMSMKVMQLLRGVQIGGGILVILLGIASIIGILLSQKWGQIIAIVASVTAFVFTIPSLFQRMLGVTLVENLLKVIVAITIVVLCLLHKSRLTTATV